MLKSIRLVNFYSFRDTTIELNRGVNVLVGINGSGKSNFFKVFELLQEAFNGRGLRRYILETGGINEILYQGERENDEITIELELSEPYIHLENLVNLHSFSFFYRLTIKENQKEYSLIEKAWFGDTDVFLSQNGSQEPLIKQRFFQNEIDDNLEFGGLREFLNPNYLKLYMQFDTRVEAKIRKPNLSIPEKTLSSNGSNLTQVLNTIKINNKKTYRKIIAALKNVNPHFKDFDFRPFGTNFEMLLEEEGLNRSIHLSKVSDGTLRYLCLIAILLNVDGGEFIVIDEPETGLHPDMLYNLAEAIKEAGETATVVISTHSTQLLNYFDLQTVRVFEKDADNSTQVYAYTEGDFKGWYDTFQVGTMWRQGDIGGNRYGN